MSEAGKEFDALLPQLTDQVEAIRANAEAAGFKYCSVQVEWNFCDDGKPEARVYLSRGRGWRGADAPAAVLLCRL